MTTKLTNMIETDEYRETLRIARKGLLESAAAAKQVRLSLTKGEISNADAMELTNAIGKEIGGNLGAGKMVLTEMMLDKMELTHRAKLLEAAEE